MERGLPDEFKLESSMIKYTKKNKYTVIKKTQEQPGAYAETSHRKMRSQIHWINAHAQVICAFRYSERSSGRLGRAVAVPFKVGAFESTW